MIKDLARLATRLDNLGLTKEADVLDAALNKMAQGLTDSQRQQQKDLAVARSSGIFGGSDSLTESLPTGITDGLGKLRAPQDPYKKPSISDISGKAQPSLSVADPYKADYSGLSDKPRKPGYATTGRAGGLEKNPIQGFLYASPRSIAEFNDTLTKMFEKVPRSSKLVPADIRSNLPKGQATWTPQTQKAFGVIATLAGVPEAGKPGGWAGPGGKNGWAQKNNYEPTMAGILKFWNDKKGMVIEKLSAEWEATVAAETAKFQEKGVKEEKKDFLNLADPLMQTGPVTTPSKPKPSMTLESFERGSESQAAAGGTGKEKVNLRPLQRRLYNKVTGGTGIQLGAEGQKFFSTFTGQVTRRIETAMERSSAAKVWFSQDPSIILPDDAIMNKNVMGIYPGPSEEIKAVYQMIQEVFQYKKNKGPDSKSY